jgi:protein-S-isoprenylcysteine O-methyltransferase Ste14
MEPNTAIYIPWAIWAVTWIAAAAWANRTLKRPGIGQEWGYRILTLTGFVLLLGFFGRYANGHLQAGSLPGPLGARLWTLPPNLAWAMVWLVAAGFLFAWWARIYLGRLWSGSITRKEGHRVVDTGPYRFVRHPIYTGLIAAGIATAAVNGTPRAVVGALCLIAGYWLKARIEERFLRGELGAEAYDAYARKTAMLIPFVTL